MDWIKRIFRKAGQPAADSAAKSQESVTREELRQRYASLYQSAVHLRAGAGGFSRLGGLPTMPAEIDWPAWKDKPLAFLAQIDLSEIDRVYPSFLPASGYLYFFYDQDQGVWGFDPKDIGAWRVFYAKGDPSQWSERPAPSGLAKECVYQPKPVHAQRIELLPDSQCLPRDGFAWDRDGDAFLELRGEAFENLPRHQMHGYPSPVQNADMEDECQLASNGIYVGNQEGYKDPRVPELRAGSADWKLLVQLDSDDDTGWMWGDVGTLYFWVREQDARKGDFSKVWMVLQCC